MVGPPSGRGVGTTCPHAASPTPAIVAMPPRTAPRPRRALPRGRRCACQRVCRRCGAATRTSACVRPARRLRSSPGGPCQSRSRRPVGRSLRAILFLTPAPPRRQYFASRVSAGRADISDEPLNFLERLNPGHLLHRGLTPWTADHVLLSGIRHNKPRLSSPKLKLVNARTFPLYRQKVLTRFFAAMPIRSHLGGQHFDPETIRLMGIAFEMALVSLQRTDGRSIQPVRRSLRRS